MAKRSRIEDRVERRTQEIGQDLLDRLEHGTPSMFHGRWWEDQLLNWAMEDEAIKLQMFRFVDVLPMLRDHRSIARHLEEYFQEVRERLPFAARLGLDLSTGNSILSRALAWNARTNVSRMARRFIAGETVCQVLDSVEELRRSGYAFTLDLLGEAVISEKEADRYQQTYMDLIVGMSEPVGSWSEVNRIDRDSAGALPRLNLSLKLSALDSRFSTIDPIGTTERVCSRLRPILRLAQEHHVFVNFDMEQRDYRSLTSGIFRQILMEDEFREFPDAGIAVQAYLQDTATELKSLLKWVRKRKTPVTVRLVKGAYWDYETTMAESRGWPCPVFQRKWQSDDSFEKQVRFILKHHQWLRPALGSHNLRSLAHGLAWAEEYGVPEQNLEIQMLYGMGDEQAHLFSEMGYRVRIYTPFGQLIPGMAYLVRRLLENTSNDSFLRQSLTEHRRPELLLMKPSEHAAEEPVTESVTATGFSNEPPTDFSIEDNRSAMQQALEDVRSEFSREYPLVIGGKSCDSRSILVSRNPSDTSQVVGRVASASSDQAADAVREAERAFPQWASTDAGRRADCLELIAAEIRTRRFELAAWIISEVGKPWVEADAEVSEAVDFCMYYAQEMRRLHQPQECHLKGEENTYCYRPRGVAVVIAPWNFPLAILTGMTAAAMVAGNTVIMKPAEQSSVVASKLMDIIQNSDVPDGVVNLVSGVGETIGPELVCSPDVDLICFTGSRSVGLEINRLAAETDDRQLNVRRVIAEMGGKNAIIVDEDADLDEAIPGILRSAFAYAGQKCSACSRVIVLGGIYDRFMQRLVEATECLKLGPADDPETQIGPVIDDDARKRILATIAGLDPEHDGTLVWEGSSEELANQGTFVGPHVIADARSDSPICQQELFGPVLPVIRARTLDDAFALANDTRFALTGGVYSRSPVTLKRARSEFEVGNLYLNREITGAMVQRHPFGGYRMSGTGSKAGGPDYLLQFLVPVNITENTMRNGFAPASVE
ncbi:MAG: proline dehydrogenase family protein [Fuerstiella sp.]|nr:proline dehydrogenase family protein [Fuerstiella sp.]